VNLRKEKKMHANIRTEVMKEYIRVSMTGDRSRAKDLQAEILDIWRAIADECRATDVYRVLIVSEVKGKLPTMKTFEINKQLYSLGFGPPARIAFVEAHDDAHEELRFGENVAVNRAVNARFFNDENEALSWVLG
jgi:hypothetical protein